MFIFWYFAVRTQSDIVRARSNLSKMIDRRDRSWVSFSVLALLLPTAFSIFLIYQCYYIFFVKNFYASCRLHCMIYIQIYRSGNKYKVIKHSILVQIWVIKVFLSFNKGYLQNTKFEWWIGLTNARAKIQAYFTYRVIDIEHFSNPISRSTHKKMRKQTCELIG